MTPARPRILFIFGTRPEIIKLAPVISQTEQEADFKPVLLHTGQHKELADEMLSIFGLSPNFNLSVMSENQSLFSLSSKILDRFGEIFSRDTFDLIVVQGDTTSAFLGALAGYYNKIPVAHVEAGLRTMDKFNPFPEEMNRRLVGNLCDLHFPPTETSRQNLLREGIPPEKITVTGNTVIDALFHALEIPHNPPKDLSEIYSNPLTKLILVTTHRRENFGDPHRRVFQALLKIVKAAPEAKILFPVHPNPNVRSQVAAMLDHHPQIHLSAPLGYLDFLHAMKNSFVILSDSGGVQEEAPSLKKPVLVLRDQTERPEGIKSGCLKLVGTDEEKIFQETEALFKNPTAYDRMTRNPNPYGDGKASERILTAIRNFLGNQRR